MFYIKNVKSYLQHNINLSWENTAIAMCHGI